VQHIRNFINHYFQSWLNKSSNQSVKRTRFFRMRAKHLMREGYKRIKVYYKEKVKFKGRLREFLKMRADHLLYKALNGLYGYTKDHELQRKMRKVSAFLFLEKTLRRSFVAFQN
jgi:hypothetical protein